MIRSMSVDLGEIFGNNDQEEVLPESADQTLNESLPDGMDDVEVESRDITDNLLYFLVQPKVRQKGDLKIGEIILIYLLEGGWKKAYLASKNSRYFKN